MSKGNPTHGAQGDPATTHSNLRVFETGREPFCPEIIDVIKMTTSAIDRIMTKGSEKSTFGQWFDKDSRRYNADRAINHLCQAMMQLDGNRPKFDDNCEDAIDHLERALVRVAFLLFKTKRGKIL